MPNNNRTEIRAIDLIKTSKTHSLKDEMNTDTVNKYLCLGHFDAIRVRKLACEYENNPFEIIWGDCSKCNQDEQYTKTVFPLYLLHDSSNGTQLNLFWEKKFPCMVISRVHCNWPDNFDTISILKTHVLGLNESDDASLPQLGDLTVEVNGEYVHCAFYHTLELGDIVVVLKSNSMVSCLNIAKKTLENSSVGDTYSYCTLHSSLFCADKFDNSIYNEMESPESGYAKENAEKSFKQPILNIGVRFSIRSTKLSKSILSKLCTTEKAFFVTGTSDALINWNNLSLEEFCSKVQLLLNTHVITENGNDFLFGLYDAFDDVVTRLGIEYGEVANEEKSDATFRNVLNMQKDYTQKVEKLINVLPHDICGWANALLVQFKTLLTMMNNCVMDDLSLLLWPSVTAFIDRLHFMLCIEKRTNIGKEYTEDICDFLNGWASLANDILHLESQLAQNPELQSSRAYVPASLLAYYMAVLNDFNNLLIKIDKKPSSLNFIPLITHTLESRTNTLCVLDPHREGRSNYDNNCPLLVSLPVSLMYYPAETIPVLCHEMAHYTGNDVRLREIRYECIKKTCASLVKYCWDLESLPLKNNSDDIRIIDFLALKIDEIVQPEIKDYIHLMRDDLPFYLKSIFLQWEVLSEIIMKNCDTRNLEVRFINYIQEMTPIKQDERFNTLCDRLFDILLLYRECYADIVAIICLELSKEQYFRSMYLREYSNVLQLGNRKRTENLCFQAAIVSCTIQVTQCKSQSSFKASCSFVENDLMTNFEKKVKSYEEQIFLLDDIYYTEDSSKKNSECLFFQFESRPLYNYLKLCAKTLSKALIDAEVCKIQSKLHNLMNIVSELPVNLEAFKKAIALYHSDIIKKE